jgi:hypothetical protein
MNGLWFWQDEIELTAFAGDDGAVIVLRWPWGDLVSKDDLLPGDHVLFAADGTVLELKRPRQLTAPPAAITNRSRTPAARPLQRRLGR